MGGWHYPICGWEHSMSCLGKYESNTGAESGSTINIFESHPVDLSSALKSIKQHMDKVMEH